MKKIIASVAFVALMSFGGAVFAAEPGVSECTTSPCEMTECTQEM